MVMALETGGKTTERDEIWVYNEGEGWWLVAGARADRLRMSIGCWGDHTLYTYGFPIGERLRRGMRYGCTTRVKGGGWSAS